MSEKIKYTSYLAGAIESDSSSGMTSWRNEIKEKLSHKDIIFYDPVEREAQKTGKKSGDHIKYVMGLKQSGHWEKFFEEMNKIWVGNLKPREHELLDMFKFLRIRKQIDGNEVRDLGFWADWEAVIRSDFLIAYIKKDTPTIGTIGEITVAMLLQIPVYLILDHPKTEANSSLIYYVMYSGGEIFYNIKETVDFIKNKYKLGD